MPRTLPFLRHALFGACLALLGTAAQAGEIAVIVKTTNSTFWQNVNKGAEAGIKEVPGHTMTFAGPASESAIADQVNLVENAVNRRVAGIVLAPSDPDALVPAIKKAWEARIPVVLIDSQVSDAGKAYYQSFLTTDNRAAGERCAKEMIARVGTTGKVAIMSYVAGAGSEVGRVGAFKSYLQANSKLEVVGPFYSQSQMATAMNQTTDVLAAHKDLKGIFGANEPTAVGMGRARQPGPAEVRPGRRARGHRRAGLVPDGPAGREDRARRAAEEAGAQVPRHRRRVGAQGQPAVARSQGGPVLITDRPRTLRMDRLRTRRLARTDLRLSTLGLGAAALAGLYDAVDGATATATLQAAWDQGLRYIDTAPFYGYTRSERRVGEFLAGKPRGSFVVSTKVGRLMHPDPTVQPGSDGWADPLPFRPAFDYSHAGVMRSFEDSLERLGLDRIDILLVHDIGRVTHGENHAQHWQALTAGGGFRALEELRSQGRVHAIGLGVNEWEVARDALAAAPINCVLLAGRYTLLEQASLGFMDQCAAAGVSVLVGGPFNSGLLAGQPKYNYGDVPPDVMRRTQALRAACAEFDVPLEAAALQFPLAHPAAACVLAGMRSPEQVTANAAWLRRRAPNELWLALRDRGLIDPAAPLPTSSKEG
jgi:D-threo-aldose 1-dehydrogenase